MFGKPNTQFMIYFVFALFYAISRYIGLYGNKIQM